MSSDRRRPTREEREAARREAREAANVARRKAKEVGERARQKAKQVGEEAREEAIEAAMAARREAEAARRGGGAGTGVPLVGEDPFGLLWEDADPAPPARGRGRGRGGAGLHRDEIVAAALKLADAEGPDAVSMRRIAKDLGVGTMSLYHHIPTKDDLLDLMHDHVMGELLIPGDELAGDWQEALAQISRRTKAVYERHHWMVSGAWERPQFGPRAFAHIEQSLAIMAGVPTAQMLQMLGVADDYVIGFVSRRVATRAALRRADMDMAAYQEALRPYVEKLLAERADEFPNLARFAGEDWNQDEDERFEQGLRWLIAGMAQAVPSGG